MRTEITEIERAISTICAKQSPKSRTWSAGGRTSRTDGAVIATLTDATVDAVFEDDSLEVATTSRSTADVNREEQAKIVAGLSAQLALLESQCTNLRRMLEITAQNSR